MPFDNPIKPFGRGLEIAIPGQLIVCPRLTMGQRRHFVDHIEKLPKDGPDAGQAQEQVVLDMVEAALRRHYPNVNQTDIRDSFSDEDIIDMWFYAMNSVRGEAQEKNVKAA